MKAIHCFIIAPTDAPACRCGPQRKYFEQPVKHIQDVIRYARVLVGVRASARSDEQLEDCLAYLSAIRLHNTPSPLMQEAAAMEKQISDLYALPSLPCNARCGLHDFSVRHRHYRVIVQADLFRGGYEAKLLEDGVLWSPNGSTAVKAHAALVRETADSGREWLAVSREIARVCVRHV